MDVSAVQAAPRRRLLTVPAVTGIAYTLSWIAGLAVAADDPARGRGRFHRNRTTGAAPRTFFQLLYGRLHPSGGGQERKPVQARRSQKTVIDRL